MFLFRSNWDGFIDIALTRCLHPCPVACNNTSAQLLFDTRSKLWRIAIDNAIHGSFIRDVTLGRYLPSWVLNF